MWFVSAEPSGSYYVPYTEGFGLKMQFALNSQKYSAQRMITVHVHLASMFDTRAGFLQMCLMIVDLVTATLNIASCHLRISSVFCAQLDTLDVEIIMLQCVGPKEG